MGLLEIPDLLPVRGVQASACSAGLYSSNRLDLALLCFNSEANCAAVFTRNTFCAAPIIVAKNHLRRTLPQYCLINSGNANAGLGDEGTAATLDVCRSLAALTDSEVEAILPFSTGIIGEPLPVEKIKKSIPFLLENLSDNAWLDVAHAIMTTDTVAKGVSKRLILAGKEITITGIAKGAGMIQPNMATMLAYIATDANIDNSLVQKLLNEAVEVSFNCLSVDGDTSTNDACFFIATGGSDVPLINSLTEAAYSEFKAALIEVCTYLAQAIVRDGEGATKFITVKISDGKSVKECKEIAFTVANSPLVKTAFFASDPNWGRVLAAVGKVDLDNLDIKKISIFINGVCIVERGKKSASYIEAKGQETMAKHDITIHIMLGRGKAAAEVWTCDLSYEYIRINAEYRT